MPILDRVALRVKDLKNVTIAKMDLTKNDLPIRDIIVHHYPTAYLFPAGDGGDTVSITKGSNLFPVTFKKAINFANYDGENTKHDVTKPHAHWSVDNIVHFIVHETVLKATLVDELFHLVLTPVVSKWRMERDASYIFLSFTSTLYIIYICVCVLKYTRMC